MVYRPPKLLEWLSVAAGGLLLLAAFAPIPDPWDRVMSGVGSALIFAYLGITWREKRRLRQAGQSSSAATSSGDQL